MADHDEDEIQASGDKAIEDRGDKHDQFESGSAQGAGSGGQVHGSQQITNQPGSGAGGSGSQGGGGQGNLKGR